MVVSRRPDTADRSSSSPTAENRRILDAPGGDESSNFAATTPGRPFPDGRSGGGVVPRAGSRPTECPSTREDEAADLSRSRARRGPTFPGLVEARRRRLAEGRRGAPFGAGGASRYRARREGEKADEGRSCRSLHDRPLALGRPAARHFSSSFFRAVLVRSETSSPACESRNLSSASSSLHRLPTAPTPISAPEKVSSPEVPPRSYLRGSLCLAACRDTRVMPLCY